MIRSSSQSKVNSMGVRDLKPTKGKTDPARQLDSDDSSDEESNETLPVPAMQSLSLEEQANPRPPSKTVQQFSFLKNRPISKRNKDGLSHQPKSRGKIQKLQKRIKELQSKLEEYKNKENACPHCHFYQNAASASLSQGMTPEPSSMRRNNSRESLEFEKVDFMSPLMCSPEMEEKSWVFLGTVMIAMGSKVMDMDGSINVFKVVKESVDRIRRQVQKSESKLTMDFFLGRESMVVEPKMDELSFDPFYSKEEPHGGLQLQGVRVESVNEYQLFFDQKLSFNVNYQALITAMEYLKENCNLQYS